MLILGYFDIFYIFGAFLLILNQKKIQNLKKKCLNIWKIGPKNADFSLFLTKMNCMVKMTTPYPSPYCALSSCNILGKNNKPFLR